MEIYFTPAPPKASVGSGSMVTHYGYHIAVDGRQFWYLALHVDPRHEPECRAVQAGAAYALDDRDDIDTSVHLAPDPLRLNSPQVPNARFACHCEDRDGHVIVRVAGLADEVDRVAGKLAGRRR
ncbi:hypothetical protein [Sphingomonas sp. STIS6.2]|uniref:hypothetical protein n=1 Tax=Sphingomonas sp. STIS6.2 TaxID=1379700 RepID=UPI00131C5345|nr:hypothetical protein [Sphingomonas sp. STIS6.2]